MNGSFTFSSPAADADEDRIGNCRPPRSTRFRPGQSGNPRGRPKRPRGLSGLVARVFGQRVEAEENGRRRRITKLEAALTQLVNNAAKGEHRSTQLALTLLGDASALPEPRKPERSREGDALVVAEIVRRLSRRPPSCDPLG
jgi:hypothetical protein